MPYVLSNSSGEFEKVERREPRAEHWQIYHRAKREQPGLVDAMYETIREIVKSEQYLDTDRRFPNSTWLGRQILLNWKYKVEWGAFCGYDRDVSGALFGELMWTMMYDDEQDWCTTRSSTTKPTHVERVYWRL